jgi:acetyl/propionyl-CoA carboxylase alpha subunit
VKVTATGSTFPQALGRMDRALREFRIRGVKTNIPFVENVIAHPVFRAGDATTTLIRHHARAVRVRAAPRPRHATAQLPGRDHRQRQPQLEGIQAHKYLRPAQSARSGTPKYLRPPAPARSCSNSERADSLPGSKNSNRS